MNSIEKMLDMLKYIKWINVDEEEWKELEEKNK